MRVYTYYQAADGLPYPVELLSEWCKTWQRHGWEPCLLTTSTARLHPDYDKILAAVQKLPTVNGRQYEDACYLRWAALKMAGGGLLVDYDVGNRGFRPEHLHTPEDIVHLHRYRTPCAVWATPAGLDTILGWFLNPPPNHSINGRPHMSDMYVFDVRSVACAIDPVCGEFNSAPARGLPLVHFSSEAVGPFGMSKATLMRELCK